MEKVSIPAITFTTRTYWLLTKPGILLGNAITTAGGFALASRGNIHFALFFKTMLGLSLVIASACVFNNYIDRIADEKMERTKHRPLVKGLISPKSAISFAIFIGLLGTLFLALFSNLLAVISALIGFFVYVILYSFSKYYSIHGTLIGSISGAMPPVVGYCAASSRFDAGALILFVMIALWQMPHFFAIAIYRLEDYAAASIPVLPLKRGIYRTKVQMLLYIIAFIATCSLLVVFGYVGNTYLIPLALLGSAWVYLCAKGFKCESDKQWARKMFFFSLLVVLGLCAAIPLSVH
jgi:heme o synthase